MHVSDVAVGLLAGESTYSHIVVRTRSYGWLACPEQLDRDELGGHSQWAAGLPVGESS